MTVGRLVSTRCWWGGRVFWPTLDIESVKRAPAIQLDRHVIIARCERTIDGRRVTFVPRYFDSTTHTPTSVLSFTCWRRRDNKSIRQNKDRRNCPIQRKTLKWQPLGWYVYVCFWRTAMNIRFVVATIPVAIPGKRCFSVPHAAIPAAIQIHFWSTLTFFFSIFLIFLSFFSLDPKYPCWSYPVSSGIFDLWRSCVCFENDRPMNCCFTWLIYILIK